MGKHPIDQFLYRFWPDLATAAEAIGITYQTIIKWRRTPHNFLKYLIAIRNVTGCDVNEIVAAVEDSVKWNELNAE